MAWTRRITVSVALLLAVASRAAAEDRNPVRPLTIDATVRIYDPGARTALHIRQSFGTIRWRDGGRRVALQAPAEFVNAGYGVTTLDRAGRGLLRDDRPLAPSVPRWDRGTTPAPEPRSLSLAWMFALDLARPVPAPPAREDAALAPPLEVEGPRWQASYGPLLVHTLLRL